MKKWFMVLLAVLLLPPQLSLAQTIFQSGQQIRIFSSLVTEPVKIFVISDSHIFRSDSREDPYRTYSNRMAKAYNVTRHFITGEKTDPEECLRQTVALAVERGADAIALLGDMVSYPSEAGVEWVKATLDASGIPWFYTNGNHDWHYEGMEGTELELRDRWTRERLLPLFQGHDPKLYSVEVKGVKLIFLDNGVYEILPEQLDAFRKTVKGKQAKLLFSHIPFYAPGYSPHTSAHPDWGLATDNNYPIERRPPWPAEGPGKVTKDMWKAILKACGNNGLLATFSGHLHKEMHSDVGPWRQFTVASNCTGGYYEVTVEPKE